MAAASLNRTSAHAWRLRILMLLPREVLDDFTGHAYSHKTRRTYVETLARRMWEADTLENHPFTTNVLAFLADKLLVFEYDSADDAYVALMGGGR